MRFFDGHCDTILKIAEDGADFLAAPGAAGAPHVTLPGLRAAGVGAQVFAVFVLEARYPGQARAKGLELVDAVRALCAAHPRELVLADTPRAVARASGERATHLARPDGSGGSEPDGPPPIAGAAAHVAPPAPSAAAAAAPPVAVIIGLEGADPLEGDPQALKEFHDRGVRLLTLAWDDNPFCGAVFGESRAGLSGAGEELVALCEELGVMVDVSHATDAGFWDVCAVASRPFVASHSNCRAVSAAPRNLNDEMIRALAERGGVMGINLEPGFLSNDFRLLEDRATSGFWEAVRSGSKSFDEAGAEASRAIKALPRPPLDVVAPHVKHAMNVGGEDCVGLGGDLDGIDSTPIGIDGVADYPRLAELLLASGLTEEQVEKVCWRNFARLWCQATE